MNTTVTGDPIVAAAFIERGGIVAFPTETVYGLGANVFDTAALRLIFDAKERPPDNPLIVHIAFIDDLLKLADTVTDNASRLIQAFFPGPLTVVLKKASAVPSIATAGLDTIGIRMPRHELTREFLVACKVPVAAPSANRSGRPSPTTWWAVREDLDGRIDCILRGEPTELGLESTVIDCTGERPIILRRGGISIEQIKKVVPTATSLLETDNELHLRSPGLRHKHYSPRANVRIGMPESEDSAFIGLREPTIPVRKKRVCRNVDEYARCLFEFFRECDREGIETVFCQPVGEVGIGAALMDRIGRAAE